MDPVEKHIHKLSSQLVQKTGDNSTLQGLQKCSGGNNKSWIVRTKENSYFLKHYFFSKKDKRDRLGAEISFVGFAGHSGIKNIPRLLAMDRRNLLGLFQFIEGRKPTEEDIELDYIKQALGFIRKLNYGNKGSALHSLPYASDACFSIAEHIASLERRFKSLQDIVQTDSVCLEAKQFISEVLYPEWKGLKPVIKKKIVGSGIKLEQRLCLEETIISPSDFGFHNSILTKKKLFFIDFEYAGWDDPAKMICDFFCQPEIPVPLDYFTCFVNDVSSMIYGRNKKNTLTRRSKLLFPLYRLKWCCIMLNDFVPAAGKRKKFAFFGEDRRQIQLIKAICYLKASNLKDWF